MNAPAQPSLTLDTIVDRLDAPTATTCTACSGTGAVPCDCDDDDECEHTRANDDGTRGVRCTACDGYGDHADQARAHARAVWRHAPRNVRRAVLAVVAYTAANHPVVCEYAPGCRPRITIVLHATPEQRVRLTLAGFRAYEDTKRPGVWQFVWTRGGA